MYHLEIAVKTRRDLRELRHLPREHALVSKYQKTLDSF